MVEIPEILAVIPAWTETSILCRNLSGHPLIAYTIAAALETKKPTKAIVVSQDERVASVSKEYGAEVYPFAIQETEYKIRMDSMKGRLEQTILDANDRPVEVILWLDPFTPLRTKTMLDQAIAMTYQADPDEVVQSMAVLTTAGEKLWSSQDQAAIQPALFPGRLYRQTGHVSAYQIKSARKKTADQLSKVIPLFVEPAYSPVLDQSSGWQWAEWTLQRHPPDLIYPGRLPRPLPEKTELLVLDFDGVITDNRVWVDEDGREAIAAYRSDSLGISYLRQTGVEVIVISMETNPVVAARCRKMAIPLLQGINDKATTLTKILQERRIDPSHVVYLGNDTNDVPCFPIVGCAAVVADAQPGALTEADLVLTQRGGHGAVRELCDRLIEKHKGS